MFNLFSYAIEGHGRLLRLLSPRLSPSATAEDSLLLRAICDRLVAPLMPSFEAAGVDTVMQVWTDVRP